MNKTATILATLLLAFVLVACNSGTPAPESPPQNPQVILTATPPTVEPGGTTLVAWDVQHADDVTVTSSDEAHVITNAKDASGTYEATIIQATTFTVTADEVTRSVRVSLNTVEEPDPTDPSPGDDGDLVVTVALTNGRAPAVVSLDATNLPSEFTSLTGNYLWSVEQFRPFDELPWAPIPELEYRTESLHYSFTLHNGGHYQVTLSHPNSTLTFMAELQIPEADVDMHVVQFAPGATDTTIDITHTSAWELFIPEWLTASQNSGSGSTTVTLAIDTSSPDAYTGTVTLRTPHGGPGQPVEPVDDITRHVHYEFPRLAGIVTPAWDELKPVSRVTAQSRATRPPHPDSPIRSLPETSGELIFVFDAHLTEAATVIRNMAGVTKVTQLNSLSMLIVNTSDMRATAAAGAQLPGFGYVEEHQLITPEPLTDYETDYDLPPRQYFGTEWQGSLRGHLDRLNITALREEHGNLTGEGVTIAVIDVGFHEYHHSISDRVISVHHPILNPDDTVSLQPRTDLHESCLPFTHGLAVTSTAAGADTGHANETPGIAYEADLLLFDFLVYSEEMGICGNGGVALPVIADYIINGGDLRAQVINASWGHQDPIMFSDDPSYSLNLVVQSLNDAGVTFVAAAGNTPGEPVAWPARHPAVIGTASLNRGTIIPEPVRHYADERMTVMGIGQLDALPAFYNPDTGVITRGAQAGTSISSPQVAGIVALLLEALPGITPDQIREALTATAHRAYLTGSSLYDNSGGYGVVDALAAYRYLQNPNHVPFHQLRVLINGEEAPVTVRPDGTFMTPYLQPGTYTITVTTEGQNDVLWEARKTIEAIANLPSGDQGSLQFVPQQP